MAPHRQISNRRILQYVVLGYAAFASAWILLSDWLIFQLFRDAHSVFQSGALKGLGFVIVTSGGLFLLLRALLRTRQRAEQAETASTMIATMPLPTLFASIPVVVYVLEQRDHGYEPVWVSDNIRTIIGYDMETALTPGWWHKNLHPDDREQALTTSAMIVEQQYGSHEYRFRRGDGNYVYVLDELQRMASSAAGAPRFIGVWTDVSLRHTSRQEILDYATRLEQAMYSTVNAVAQLTELRDPYTAGHEHRVGEIAAAIAAEMGYDEHFQQGLRIAGSLHDIGKIGVPAEILTRPGQLTPAEYGLVKEHAENGWKILQSIDFPWPVAEVARQHHERMNGSGYPRGLKGDAILPEARIVALADLIESMAMNRPYRAGLGIERALEEIENNAGRLYDTEVAAACLRLFRERGYQLPPA